MHGYLVTIKIDGYTRDAIVIAKNRTSAWNKYLRNQPIELSNYRNASFTVSIELMSNTVIQ